MTLSPPIFNEKLTAQLKRDEGVVPYAYEDSLGYLTIGTGHLVDKRKGGFLPPFIIDLLLEHDVETHGQALFAALPWVKDLSPARQGVLVNLCFNIGLQGVLGFAQTLAAIKAGDYESASERMLDSKWAKQVGPRATRLALQMKTDVWQ